MHNKLIDTHIHLDNERFDGDREEALHRAGEAGVTKLVLPAVDSGSHEAVIELARRWPERCFALMGLHPTSVNDNPRFREELELIESLLKNPPVRFYGIGEAGLDLYWSRDFLAQQQEALRRQIELALVYGLPIVLHVREAFEEMIDLLAAYRGRDLRGVFHSFAGTAEHYRALRAMGDFHFGIGGVVTYKNSVVAATVGEMALEELVLETDAPYLPPVPFRGQRNESAWLTHIVERIAGIKGVPPEEVARVTTANAEGLFEI